LPISAWSGPGRTDTPTPRSRLHLQRWGQTSWPLLQWAPLDLARGAPSASPQHRRRTPPARPMSRRVSTLRAWPCHGHWRTWSSLKMPRMTRMPWRQARRDGLTWPAGPDTYLVRPSAPSPSSSLSPPTPPPFYPGDDPVGRSKAHRWADEDSECFEAMVTPVSSSTSYLDAVLRGSLVQTSSLPVWVVPQPTVGGSRGCAAAWQGRLIAGGARCNVPSAGAMLRRCSRGPHRRRPLLELVHGLPAQPVEGRILAP
jgi:hypothetical protein